MQPTQLSEEVQFLYASIFKQVQESGDIIGSILIICRFVNESSVPVKFDVSRLRQIALRSLDKETSTYLWHINALIAAAADFEHLLLGIEMMFERFLGSRQLYLKEKAKQKAQALTEARDTKFLGNEIVSFVNSYYEDPESADDSANQEKTMDASQAKAATPETHETDAKTRIVVMTTPNPKLRSSKPAQSLQHEWLNDENENVANLMMPEPDELQEYRGKISSPISFRMRQQKRMMQSERGSTTASTCVSFIGAGDSLLDGMHLMETQSRVSIEPEVASPFNVDKFAQSVDMITQDMVETGF